MFQKTSWGRLQRQIQRKGAEQPLRAFRSVALYKPLCRLAMSWFYFIGAPTCAGGFDVVGPNEGLIRAGRCPHLLFPTVYGGARAASCCVQDALQISRSLPQGSFCLEEAPTFELIWIILIWGNELSFGSFSPLRSALSPQSHFCAPCYCCTSSLWALPAAGEACSIPWELLLISSQAPGQLPCAQRPSWGVCVSY